MWRIALAAMVGSSIEWYDFFLYGIAAATVFPTLYFPRSAPLVGTLLSFSTFAIGFVARPVGGVVFGHFGDRIGRKRSLVIALALMGIATTAIGLLPTYQTIGAVAPVALVLFRFLQGLAIGGQWGGVVLLVTESAPAGRRGFYGSFAQLGVPAGVILANVMFLAVTAWSSPAAFLAWGWRIPFLSSVVLIGVGVYIQRRIEESPAFLKLQATRAAAPAAPAGRSPVLEVLIRHPRTVLLAAGAFVATNGNFYIYITFVVAYATRTLGMPQATILLAVLVSAMVCAPALASFAALSDRVGRRSVFLAGAVLSGIFAFGFFPLIGLKTLSAAIVALSIGEILLAMMYGPQAAFYAELFGTEMRYSGASLGYQLGSIFGGAFAPLIATSLLARTGSAFAISVYMAGLCAVAAISVLLLTETHRRDLHEIAGTK
jgi:metabolite-proton symporter